MIAIRGNNAIRSRDRGFHADGDGFLAVVEVAEAADELGLVEGVGGDLGAAHEGHGAEEGEEFGGGGGDGAGWGVDVVGCKGDAGFDCDGIGGGEVAREEWGEEGGVGEGVAAREVGERHGHGG